jgi:protease YdgD
MWAPFYGSRIECTTVAIAPDQALTAADCLFEEASGRRMQPQSLHVLMGFARDKHQIDALVQGYHFDIGYDHERPYDTLDSPWGCIEAYGAAAGGPPWHCAREYSAGYRQPMTGGYGKDCAFMMTVDSRCRVRQWSAKAPPHQ